jgi:MFS family permease
MAPLSDTDPESAAREPGKRGPFWETPARYGAAEALTSMGTIAAPLLAGFSLAGFVQVLTMGPEDVRWRGAPALFLMLAAIWLILAVQATFWARQYQVTPSDMTEWWPDWKQPYRARMLRRELEEHNAGFRRWSRLARVAYELGLLCIITALTLLAVPPVPKSDAWRWLAVAAGTIAFTAELGWGFLALTRPHKKRAT